MWWCTPGTMGSASFFLRVRLLKAILRSCWSLTLSWCAWWNVGCNPSLRRCSGPKGCTCFGRPFRCFGLFSVRLHPLLSPQGGRDVALSSNLVTGWHSVPKRHGPTSMKARHNWPMFLGRVLKGRRWTSGLATCQKCGFPRKEKLEVHEAQKIFWWLENEALEPKKSTAYWGKVVANASIHQPRLWGVLTSAWT